MMQAMILRTVNAMQIEYPVTYLGASRARKAKTAIMPPMLPNCNNLLIDMECFNVAGHVQLTPTCHALPTERRWWPPRFMLNQQTIIGMAL